jgi:ligand-binding SRPBCC domain-containing protein
MKLYKLEFVQKLSVRMAEAWDFFSNPTNLPRITPPSLRITINSPVPQKMYSGMVITYRIRPMPFISTNWVTEITHVKKPHFFVDEQRLGPYRFWHHQHHFKEIEGGVDMRDLVHYVLPWGPIGCLVHGLLIRRRLYNIFSYRYRILEDMFGESG